MNYATLCFPDRATAIAAAEALGFWDSEADALRNDGQTVRPNGTAFSWSIDEIGEVVDEPAVIDPESGELITPATFKAGWYVNAAGELPAAVEPYIVPYGSGGRVFAGTEPDA